MVNPSPNPFDGFDVSIDRNADVPIGVQLAWALRTRIQDGTFKPGQRLPGLREIAEATGVNVNTVRAVYQRLDHEGLIATQQGSGTFVAPGARGHSEVARIAINASQEAREAGVDPRDLAAALYVAREPNAVTTDAAATQRRTLRAQIAALERAASELEANYPGLLPARTATRAGRGPRILGVEDLEQVRSHLVRRLAAIQGAIDQESLPDDHDQVGGKKTAGAGRQETRRAAPTKPKRPARPQSTTRPATAGG